MSKLLSNSKQQNLEVDISDDILTEYYDSAIKMQTKMQPIDASYIISEDIIKSRSYAIKSFVDNIFVKDTLSFTDAFYITLDMIATYTTNKHITIISYIPELCEQDYRIGYQKASDGSHVMLLSNSRFVKLLQHIKYRKNVDLLIMMYNDALAMFSLCTCRLTRRMSFVCGIITFNKLVDGFICEYFRVNVRNITDVLLLLDKNTVKKLDKYEVDFKLYIRQVNLIRFDTLLFNASLFSNKIIILLLKLSKIYNNRTII